LYGTTSLGGGINECGIPLSAGCGTFFKINPEGAFTTVHSFVGSDGTSYPHAALIQGSNGNFYGTSDGGGSGANCNGGCGTVFEITPTCTVTVLHSFDLSDGYFPSALVQSADGNLYGVTVVGGSSNACFDGCGTVFQVSPAGVFTMLHASPARQATAPTLAAAWLKGKTATSMVQPARAATSFTRAFTMGAVQLSKSVLKVP